MWDPFETVTTYAIFALLMKIAFLVDIASARRAGKLQAFTDDPPYAVFDRDKVGLHPYSKFLTHVASNFYINQTVFLPTFFLKPHPHKDEEKVHSLAVLRMLAFYLDRTKELQSCP